MMQSSQAHSSHLRPAVYRVAVWISGLMTCFRCKAPAATTLFIRTDFSSIYHKTMAHKSHEDTSSNCNNS